MGSAMGAASQLPGSLERGPSDMDLHVNKNVVMMMSIKYNHPA